MARKRFFALACLTLLLGLGPIPGEARPVRIIPYDQMTTEADLVVIATPIEVKELTEVITLPNTRTQVVGLETTFRAVVVLKDEPVDAEAEREMTFVLHHYRLRFPPGPRTLVFNAFSLVSFNPLKKRQYLMFLKCESDGRFVPFNGQHDPAFSIEPLHQRLWASPVPTEPR